MIIKHRKKPKELLILESLVNRTKDIPKKYYLRYSNLKKGFEGELKFDQWFDQDSSENWIQLNDLLFEVNHSTFQIDSLIITSDQLFLFEVKNFEGDFKIESNRWFTLSGKEIQNPLIQLQKCETLLRQLLQQHNIHLNISSYLVFINPEFHLFNTPTHAPFIFASQLNRFMKNFQQQHTQKVASNSSIIQKLLALHSENRRQYRELEYHYDDLNKGILCKKCHSLNTQIKGRTLSCFDCHFKEPNDPAIQRTIIEYQLLFPDKPLFTNTLLDWCKCIRSRKTLLRLLKMDYKLTGHGKSSKFILNPLK
ncbi:nuclease-related domain-containing protein [Alkalihalobacillus sp. 1P02AB]|uniref:nuclease-related domain-containing protein n=1 Tax=Alkalihalobacillus sp. 1P02AB TaxID=3132260 RepID=UPI0039A6AF44